LSFFVTFPAPSLWTDSVSFCRSAVFARQTVQPYFPDTPTSCPMCEQGYASINTCTQTAPILAKISSLFFNPGGFINVIKCSCTDTFQSVFPQCADCFETTNQTVVLDMPDLPGALVGKQDTRIRKLALPHCLQLEWRDNTVRDGCRNQCSGHTFILSCSTQGSRWFDCNIFHHRHFGPPYFRRFVAMIYCAEVNITPQSFVYTTDSCDGPYFFSLVVYLLIVNNNGCSGPSQSQASLDEASIAVACLRIFVG
ncbi:hypothetical protein F5148DRAFT_1337971, partial [Russula earlei]